MLSKGEIGKCNLVDPASSEKPKNDIPEVTIVHR